MIAISVTCISYLLCMVSSTCNLFHLLTYKSSTCSTPTTPAPWHTESCVCFSSRGTLWQGGQLLYPGQPCHQLQEYLPPFVLFLLITNITSCFISLLLIFIITCKKCNTKLIHWRTPGTEGSCKPMLDNNNFITSLQTDK